MSPTPPLPVTEDTPPDMLAGSMDLQVVLPSGKSVKMSVERSTPMMDLLVQVTTANKIAPGSHVLQALGERGVLPYKPSTPIGTLDTWTIQVVPKSRLGSASSKKGSLKPSNQQPFEQTFRLQVHLPRNQLFVTRTSAKIALSDILSQVCTEKNLDVSKYELRHPGNLEEVLDLRCSLADYKLQEVVLAGRSARHLDSRVCSEDIMVLHREEEQRRQQARTSSGGGSTSSSAPGRFFGVFKRNRSSAGEGSVSSDSLGGRSVSPARSDESVSRSASPPAPGLPPTMVPPPARPLRKRRPAPAPPAPGNNKLAQQQDTQAQQGSSNNEDKVKAEKGTLISHSRNSSDSSGYHEASVLSESPDSHSGPQTFDSSGVDSLPRRSKLTPMMEHSHALSRSLSSLAAGAQASKPSPLSTSTTTLSSSAVHPVPRKKRAAPLPPKTLAKSASDDVASEGMLKTASLDWSLRDKDAAALDKSSSLPARARLSREQPGSVSSLDSASKVSLRSASSTEEDEEDEGPRAPPQQAPVAPPRAPPSPRLAPAVDSPASSRPDPVEAGHVAIPVPTPKPRSRVGTLERRDARPSVPVPRPRKMSADAQQDETCVLEDAGSVVSDAVALRSVAAAGGRKDTDDLEDSALEDVRDEFVFLKYRSASVMSDFASVTSDAASVASSGRELSDPDEPGALPRTRSDADAAQRFLRGSLDKGRRGGRGRHRASDGSVTSLRSMDDVPHFLSGAANIGRWGSVEALDVADEAAGRQPAWVLGADESDVEVECLEGNHGDSQPQGESQTEAVTAAEIVAPLSEPQPKTATPRTEERAPSNGMTLPEPVMPPSPADGGDEPLDIEWEYQLPAPPSAFRDRASPSIVEGQTVPLEDARAFREPDGSVDSGDFSLTDVPDESASGRKTLDDFSVRISGGEITRINPLFDPRQFEGSQEEDAARVSLPTMAGLAWSSKSKEYATDTKMMELADRATEKSSVPSVGITDAFQPQMLSNFKISTYQHRRDIDSIFREAEVESGAVDNWGFKRPLPVAAQQYGSTNSLEAARDVGAGPQGRGDAGAKLQSSAVKRSASHVSLAGPGKPVVGQPWRAESGRAPSLGNLSREVPQDTPESGDVRRGSGPQVQLVGKARSELDLHQVGNGLPREETTHDCVSRKTVDERGKKDAPLQSLQVLRSILPHVVRSSVPDEGNDISSTNRKGEQSINRSSTEASSERSSSGSEVIDSVSVSQAGDRKSSVPEGQGRTLSGSETRGRKSSGSEDQDRKPSLVSEIRDSIPTDSQIQDRKTSDMGMQLEKNKLGSSRSSGSERHDVPAAEEAGERRYRYQGPPAIKLSSWSERPKVKVDIKQDSDYRIGFGKEPSTKVKAEEPESRPKEVPAVKVASGEQTKVEQAPLTMRLVSNTPARKGIPTSQILEAISRPEPPFELAVPSKEPARTSVHVGRTHADPSRVPIVRAVELKKPYQQQLRSGAGVSISIVRQDEEVIVGGERVDGLAKDAGFAGVNSLARMFSAGAIKPYKSARPLSAYEYGGGEKSDEDAAKKPENFPNVYRSASITNLSAPSVTVNSADSAGQRKYTSVVGINKSVGPSVVKVNGFSGPRQPVPVVKGFQVASQPASSVSVRIEHQAPAEANRPHARVQRSESAFAKTSPFSVSRDQPPAVVGVHEKPTPWKQSVAKTRSLPGPGEAVPPPPQLPHVSGDVLVRPPQPKTSVASAGDFRGQLMEAIRNHGGRDTLKKTSRTDSNVPNVILRV